MCLLIALQIKNKGALLSCFIRLPRDLFDIIKTPFCYFVVFLIYKNHDRNAFYICVLPCLLLCTPGNC
uniref:Uncharacterized protein n=1 Tax=Anguilla anguilla TaxID=7936 RepID=A0A0E9WMU2_ANGAN